MLEKPRGARVEMSRPLRVRGRAVKEPMMARILIVEDEPVPRMVLTKILSRDGYEVRTAANAAEAVEVGRAFLPEVLIVDWLLTDSHNGLYVAESLRASSPGLHVLFFTGLPTQKLEKEAGHLRPVRFLEKPCEFGVLRAAIQEALSGQSVSSS
jgi:DNA-binding response OmpR family regulator